MARQSSKLFKVGESYTVDAETGEAVPVEGGGFRMLPGPPGTCAWCHVAHDPGQPHNKQSLAYQMKFKAIHGRWPSWTDAMAHCEEGVKRHWRRELVALMRAEGLEVPADLQGEG